MIELKEPTKVKESDLTLLGSEKILEECLNKINQNRYKIWRQDKNVPRSNNSYCYTF